MPRTRTSSRRRKPTASTTTTTPQPPPTLQQSAWMHPTIRSWLISLRPWSFPASLGPVALAGALLHRPLSPQIYQPFHTNTSYTVTPLPNLLTLSYVLCFVVVLSFHAGANLFNTYYDFLNGNDTKATADDRGLVDHTVTPSTVFYSAVGLLSLGTAAALYLTYACPTLLYVVVVPALVLCVAYTANPCSLKKYALGDVAIFLMFGPLLMSGVCAAVTPTTSFVLRHDILLYSVPVGLSTVAILHANNARDRVADQNAGLTTLAIKLGQAKSYGLHVLLMVLTYGCVVGFVFTPVVAATRTGESDSDVASSLFSAPALDLRTAVLPAFATDVLVKGSYTTCRQLLVLLNLPWCLYVTRLFASGRMAALPQKIAQHNLLYITLLVMALSEPLFLARVLLTCLFYLGGVNNMIMWSYNVHLVHMKMTNVFGGKETGRWHGLLSKMAFAVASV